MIAPTHPFSWMCSISGLPPVEVQPSVRHRKTVKQDVGNVPKSCQPSLMRYATVQNRLKTSGSSSATCAGDAGPERAKSSAKPA